MGYYIDLSTISLEEFKNKLQESDLLPSKMKLCVEAANELSIDLII